MLTLLLLLTSAQPLPPNHPAPTGNAPPSADELLGKLDATPGLKERDKTFEIAASLARLYFGAGRYQGAQLYYRQALEKTKVARERYLSLRAQLKGNETAPDCAPSEALQLEAAVALAAKKKGAAAAACLKTALAPAREVEVLLGDAYFLGKDVSSALATWDSALALFDDNHDARYARAAALLDSRGEDVEVLKQVQAELTRVLKDAPAFPKAANAKRLLARTEAAISSGGLLKVGVSREDVQALAPAAPRQPGQAPVLTKEVMEAFQNAPRTPEMDENFKKLVEGAEVSLAGGRFQEALDAYKQVMPFQPDNPRLRAGMAWTMVKLNRQPMADNVWRVAAGSPEAIDALAATLKEKGDGEGARAVLQRLRETVPGYSPKTDVSK